MEITIKPGKGRGRNKSRSLAIRGAMTIYGAAAARDPLLAALDGAHEMRVDLSEVGEMDTAGLQLLVMLKREAAAAGARVTLSQPSPAVLEVLEGYRLAPFFNHESPNAEGTR